MKNIFLILMHKHLLLFCILSISLFLLFSIMAGCSKPVVKLPSRLPSIVKEYKHVTVPLNYRKNDMINTGVYLEKDDLFSILPSYFDGRSILKTKVGNKADNDGGGIITVNELSSYLSQKVPEASGQDQHPVRKGEIEGELVIGRVK